MMWIFAFVAFEVDIFRRLSSFWRQQSTARFFNALRTPSEMLKALLALIFALGYAALSMGYYPFPHRPIPKVIAFLFWLLGWGVSGLLAWGLRQKPIQKPEKQEGTVTESIMGFISGSVFFAIAYFFQPGLFYFHGMIGLGVMTMITCQALFKASLNEGRPNPSATSSSAQRAGGR
jgi:hypothetical protein